MAEYKAKLLSGLFVKAKNVLMSNGTNIDNVDAETVDANVFCQKSLHTVNISAQYYLISQASAIPERFRPSTQQSTIGWNYSDSQPCVFTIQTSGAIYVTDLNNTVLAGTKRIYATINYLKM